jgi:hypothetical protein
VKENLTNEEMNNLIGQALRSNHGVARDQYILFAAAFQEQLQLGSTYLAEKLSAEISQISNLNIDACVNSCIAFAGEYEDQEKCPFCTEPRFTDDGRRRNVFQPIELTKRYQGQYQDAAFIRNLQEHLNTDPSILTDKYDGDHVQQLRTRNVIVNGEDTGHKYLSDPRERIFTLALDGFTFFEMTGKREQSSKYNTWLVILIDDNISPRDRTKRKNVMILGIIAGPGQPKDFNSYFVWLRDECHRLARGVLTWDAATREFFLLRAYLIMVIGDMPAIAHMMYMKGHNGMLCCRSCYIHGARNRTEGKTTYYPVLIRPDNTCFTIQELLETSRTHDTFLEDLAAIDAQPRVTQKRRKMQLTGLSGRSILFDIDSIDFGRSFPHDLMHLAGLNTIPNLVLLWTQSGKFKKFPIDAETDLYLIDAVKWSEMGARVKKSFAYIPSNFSRPLFNVAECNGYNAEGWFFWFLAIAPYALKGLLSDPYYTHAMDLVNIIRTCMKYTITREEVEGSLTRACHKWVEDYEK